MVIFTLIITLLNYFNLIFFNLTALNLSPSQLVENTAAKTSFIACQSPDSVFAPCQSCTEFKFFTIHLFGLSDECLPWKFKQTQGHGLL